MNVVVAVVMSFGAATVSETGVSTAKEPGVRTALAGTWRGSEVVSDLRFGLVLQFKNDQSYELTFIGEYGPLNQEKGKLTAALDGQKGALTLSRDNGQESWFDGTATVTWLGGDRFALEVNGKRVEFQRVR
jgi:hypothetical protein